MVPAGRIGLRANVSIDLVHWAEIHETKEKTPEMTEICEMKLCMISDLLLLLPIGEFPNSSLDESLGGLFLSSTWTIGTGIDSSASTGGTSTGTFSWVIGSGFGISGCTMGTAVGSFLGTGLVVAGTLASRSMIIGPLESGLVTFGISSGVGPIDPPGLTSSTIRLSYLPGSASAASCWTPSIL